MTCFMLHHIEEPCSLGAHAAVIVPPTWIIKVKKPQVTAGPLVLLEQCRGQVPAASGFSRPDESRGSSDLRSLVPATPRLPSPVHPISPSLYCVGLSHGTNLLFKRNRSSAAGMFSTPFLCFGCSLGVLS